MREREGGREGEGERGGERERGRERGREGEGRGGMITIAGQTTRERRQRISDERSLKNVMLKEGSLAEKINKFAIVLRVKVRERAETD